MSARLTVAEIAKRVNGDFEGDGAAEITGLADVRHARPGQLTFLAGARYAGAAAETRATAVIVSREWHKPCPATLIRVDDPDRAFAQIASLFAPPVQGPPAGLHETAVVAPSAVLAEDVAVGPHCVIESGASIGARTVLVAGCYVGVGAAIGEDCKLYPQVSVREHVRIGNRVTIHDGSVIGSDGFGYVLGENGVRDKIPQIGSVQIGDDVEIGASVTIDRARFGVTRLGNGVKVDNLVQIAHNVVIGDHAVIVAQAGIAGSTEIGPHTILAGQVGIAGHLKIGKGARVLAQSGVWKDVADGEQVFGYPALPHKQAMSLQRLVMKLPQLRDRLGMLEEQVRELRTGRVLGE